MIATLATWLFAALLLAAALSDVARLRIPNAIPLALIAAFALAALLRPDPAVLSHLLAMGVVLLILLPLFALNVMGGGDVKLMAAVALWLGTANLLPLFILVGVAGGLFAALWLPLRWLVRRAVAAERLPVSLHAKAPLPYGVPIGIVALLLHLVQPADILMT